MNASVSVITETWLSDGDTLDRDIRDLANGAGMGMICLNRPAGSRGIAHGGVAIVNNMANSSLESIASVSSTD